MSGYLYLRESKAKWKRYWFVIKDMVLYTYKASEDVAALRSLPLLGFKIEKVTDNDNEGIDGRLLMRLSHPGQPSITFRAETVGSAERY
jgi:FYVE, RhoGEF and PH domain containing 5/6